MDHEDDPDHKDYQDPLTAPVLKNVPEYDVGTVPTSFVVDDPIDQEQVLLSMFHQATDVTTKSPRQPLSSPTSM
jgi:hypothetical protein